MSDLPNFPVRLGDRVISPVGVLPFPEDWENVHGGDSGMPRLIVPCFGPTPHSHHQANEQHELTCDMTNS